jgi:GNAT superfamily N-acetyltransferase
VAALIRLHEAAADRRRALCRAFAEQVYVPAFPVRDEREEPEIWLTLMADRPPPPAPSLHLLVAEEEPGRVVAGFVHELYRRSGAALGTYLVVAPDGRRQGLAERLLQAGYADLTAEAHALGIKALPLLAEAEDPERLTARGDQEVATQRLAILTRLGFGGC